MSRPDPLDQSGSCVYPCANHCGQGNGDADWSVLNEAPISDPSREFVPHEEHANSGSPKKDQADEPKEREGRLEDGLKAPTVGHQP
jgi:hypothetical protein